MKKPAPPTLDPHLIAVLHRSGKQWHALLINRLAGKPAITDAKSFPLSQSDRIDRWIVEHNAGTALCVLPAAAVICRTVPLPDAPAEQLTPALHLQAEAHLLGIAPPHRVAMAVLSASAGETTRSGLVLAWPESAEFLAPVTSVPVRYIGDIAAIAAILNGQRPSEPILWLDRGDGSVAIAITHSGGVTFRATNEESDNAESWSRSVGRIVAETALGVGHTGGFIQAMVQDARSKASSVAPDHASFFLPKEIIDAAGSRISGSKADPAWWNDYGIAAGAAIAATGALAPLASMLHTPPVQRPSRIRSSLEAMSRPRTAATLVVASILLLMFTPLIFSALRLAALKVRYGDVSQQLAIANASRNQVAVYKELEKQGAWPMTKLLSDIATNAPLGIELDIMRIDAGKDFSVSGNAIAKDGKTPSEIVALMVTNLRSDGIFIEPSLQWGDANNLGVLKFDINGKVKSPYHAANYPPERDFYIWTHEMRRDGKPMPKAGAPKVADKPDSETLANAGDAAPTVTPTEPEDKGDPIVTEAADPNAETTAMMADTGLSAKPGGDSPTGENNDVALPEGGGRRPSNIGGGGAGADPTQSGGENASSAAIPEPITEEQIAAMSREELQKELGKNAKARQFNRENKEVQERLKKEFNQLMAQMRKLREEGGS